MAVSPYVSRAELWLANSSFRPTFHLPNDFHPSVFLKWFPGHMAKGLLLSAVEIIFDNTEETISKWQLIHDDIFVTALRMMQLRLQKCDCVIEVHDARISFSVQKFCMIKVKRLCANLLSRAFIQHLNHPPPPPYPATPPQPASGRRRWRPWNKADLKYHVRSPVCNGVSKHFLHF